MKLKKLLFLTVASFALLGCNIALAVSSEPVLSGEVSGETSGETSGEIQTPVVSGDASGELSGDYIEVLLSTALDAGYGLEKNATLTQTLTSSVSGDETFIYEIVTTPAHGTTTLTDSSTGAFSYKPETDYIGSDVFTFRLASGDVYSNIGTISITVKAPIEPVIPFYYEDMQEHWANYSASHLAARGYIVGQSIGDEYFYFPDTQMTRGEFLLFVLSLVDYTPESEFAEIKFVDEDMYPTWLLEKAKVAYGLGIIKGSGSEGSVSLKAYDKITRAEAFVMLNNLLVSGEYIIDTTDAIDYTDKDSIPTWSLQAIKNLSAYKIVQGDSNKTINSYGIVDRGQAAELVYKVLKEMEMLKLEAVPSGDLK